MNGRLMLAAVAALTMTACATTGSEAYYNAIEAREERLAQQELRADTAIAQFAAIGDPSAKGMAIMYFSQRANAARGGVNIAPPKSAAEQFLPWASLFVPALTQIYGIQKNADIAINGSNNALAGKLDDNDMITDLVHGRGPIVGGADDVLLYPR